MRVCGKECETGSVVTVTVEGGRIVRVESGPCEAALGGPEVWLSPAFCDLQLNGYAGHDFNREAWIDASIRSNDLSALVGIAARTGTALFCPTISTDSPANMLQSLRELARAADADARLGRAVVGVHLEGPYISAEEGPVGAHPPQHVRPPDWEEFQRHQEASGGRVRICTLAPEATGALPFIEKLTETGVVAAIGHTGATPETIRDAVHAGARMSTHLGNGAHSMIRRHPNYIWEQLAHDDLDASIIADGHHLPGSVIKCFARVKGPDRLALVSDAVSLGGLPPGTYCRGQYEVLPTGKIVLAGTPYLAGAGHLLDTCIANAARYVGLTLAQATRCATLTPARILNLDGRKGQLRVGCDADLTLFRLPAEGPLDIVATVCGGEVVYRA